MMLPTVNRRGKSAEKGERSRTPKLSEGDDQSMPLNEPEKEKMPKLTAPSQSSEASHQSKNRPVQSRRSCSDVVSHAFEYANQKQTKDSKELNDSNAPATSDVTSANNFEGQIHTGPTKETHDNEDYSTEGKHSDSNSPNHILAMGQTHLRPPPNSDVPTPQASLLLNLGGRLRSLMSGGPKRGYSPTPDNYEDHFSAIPFNNDESDEQLDSKDAASSEKSEAVSQRPCHLCGSDCLARFDPEVAPFADQLCPAMAFEQHASSGTGLLRSSPTPPVGLGGRLFSTGSAPGNCSALKIVRGRANSSESRRQAIYRDSNADAE